MLTFKTTCAIIILVLARTTVSQVIIRADVAELADALDSGSSGSNTVGVRVPSSARTKPSMKMLGFLLSSDLIPSTTRTTALLPQSRSATHQQLISTQTLQQQTIYNKKGWGCLIKNSTKPRQKYRNCSKKYSFREFLMRTEPRGKLI